MRDLGRMTGDNPTLIHKARLSFLPPQFTSPAAKKFITVLMALLFLGGAYYAVQAHPELLQNVSWRHVIILTVIGAPAMILTGALEMFVLTKTAGATISFYNCLRLSIAGTAANILPLPGGAIIRTAAMSSNGASLGLASGVTILSGALWVCVAFVAAGLALISFHMIAALLFMGAALAVGVGAAYFAHKAKLSFSYVVTIGALKIIIVMTEAARYFLAFAALGVDVTIGQALVLSAATVAGAMIAIAPAGLGVREGAAAFLASLVAIAPAAGFLASALNRISMYCVLGVIVLASSFFRIEKAPAS